MYVKTCLLGHIVDNLHIFASRLFLFPMSSGLQSDETLINMLFCINIYVIR